MKIEFKWNEYREHDDSWEELVFNIDDGPWIGAQARYGTEDEDLIKFIIIESDRLLGEVVKVNDDLMNSGNPIFESISEQDLVDYDSNWGVQLGGITVIADYDMKLFTVGYMQFDSGTYFDPPSTDYIEHSEFDNINDALKCAEELWVKFQVDQDEYWNEDYDWEDDFVALFPDEEEDDLFED